MTREVPRVPRSLRKCYKCFGVPELTAWKGAPGLDPDMRQYKCLRCKAVSYRVYKGSRSLNLEELIDRH